MQRDGARKTNTGRGDENSGIVVTAVDTSWPRHIPAAAELEKPGRVGRSEDVGEGRYPN
jgi:hypothetical protein